MAEQGRRHFVRRFSGGGSRPGWGARVIVTDELVVAGSMRGVGLLEARRGEILKINEVTVESIIPLNLREFILKKSTPDLRCYRNSCNH